MSENIENSEYLPALKEKFSSCETRLSTSEDGLDKVQKVRP